MEVVYAWEWEVVFLCDAVEASVVNAHTHGSIFFLYKQNRGSKWAGGGANVFGCEVFFDLSFCFCEFGRCLAVEASGWNCVGGDEVYSVVNAIGWRDDSWELRWECFCETCGD